MPKLNLVKLPILTEDLEKNTVSYRSNYDETEKEPEVLPSQYPNILVNGAGGIAVGMATVFLLIT